MHVPTSAFICSIKGNIMQLSRRDMFKIGGLAAVTAAGLAIPLGNTVSGATASLLPASKMPKPFQTTFSRLEVLPPVKTEVDEMGPVAYYDITAKTGAVGIVPGMMTPVLGYDGLVPAKRIDVEQGTRIVMTMRNKLPQSHPTFGTPMPISTHLHGSASLPQYDGYASDVTTSRAEEVLPVPQLPAGPHTLVPRPRRALHRAERLLRLGIPIPPA